MYDIISSHAWEMKITCASSSSMPMNCIHALETLHQVGWCSSLVDTEYMEKSEILSTIRHRQPPQAFQVTAINMSTKIKRTNKSHRCNASKRFFWLARALLYHEVIQ